MNKDKPTPEHYLYEIISFYLKLNKRPYNVDINSDSNQIFTFYTDKYITKYQQYFKDGRFIREIVSKEINPKFQ